MSYEDLSLPISADSSEDARSSTPWGLSSTVVVGRFIDPLFLLIFLQRVNLAPYLTDAIAFRLQQNLFSCFDFLALAAFPSALTEAFLEVPPSAKGALVCDIDPLKKGSKDGR